LALVRFLQAPFARNKELEKRMGRKKRCPKCGSKKIDYYSTPKRCKICGFEWTVKRRTKSLKKDKVRF